MPDELIYEKTPLAADAMAAQAEPQLARRRTKRRPLRLFVLATLCVALAWVARRSDIRVESVVNTLRAFSGTSLLVALGFALLQIFLQTARFAILVPKSLNISWLRAFRVTAVGQILNIVAPARGGDVYKTLALCPSGEGSRTRSFGVVAADKAADVLGLAGVVLLLGLGHAFRWFGVLREDGARLVLVVALCVVVWAVLAKWRSTSVVRRLVLGVTHFGAGLASLRSPPRAITAVLLGAGAWLAEATTLIALTRGAGGSLSHSQAVLALLALNVGTAVPMLPANLGAFEAGVALGLHQAGVPPSSALAVAFAHHGIQLLVTSTWGGAVSLIYRFAQRGSQSVFRVQQSDKVRALSHYEKSSAHYEADVKRGPLRFMRDRERASVLRLLGPLRAGETFLDVGCGGGFYSLEAKRAAMLVCAVDAAAGMVDKLAREIDEAHVRDVETLQFDGRTFDRVVCAGVMDFVQEPNAAIVNLMRHVAPGGVLVILAPRTGFQGFYYRLEKFAVGLRVNLFSADWFAVAAANHGFLVTSLDLPLPHNLVVRLEPKSS
jgi:uncharacterized membrane protein YbhN (UPF0104 family)/SAM-dependent methyltransferase